MFSRPSAVSVAVLFLSGSASAADMLMTSADGAVTFRGSYGITSIRANELVYSGSEKLSQLIWKSRGINTFNAGLDVALPHEAYVKFATSIGTGGDHHMVDYDWDGTHKNWAFRSLHPDTRLNHYYTFNFEAGRQLLAVDATTLSLGAGIKYTDVKWTGWGGSYIYSISGFREDRGLFDPDKKGISYRQQWPVPYLGISASHTVGAWTIGGALQGGLSVEAQGTDDHWLRNLRFIDHVEASPVVMMSASIDYSVTAHAALYLSGSMDRMFRGRADTTMIDRLNGDRTILKNGAGADYQSMTVSFGLKGTF